METVKELQHLYGNGAGVKKKIKRSRRLGNVGAKEFKKEEEAEKRETKRIIQVPHAV